MTNTDGGQAPRFLTPAEAARRIGVTTMTLRRYAKQGHIRVKRLPSGHARYLETDVQRIADGTDAPP